MPAGQSAYDAARSYVQSGLSVIPIANDGSKVPVGGLWKEYQNRLPTEEELSGWYKTNSAGVAIIGGKVSGGLFVIDIEYPDFFQEFSELVELENPGLIEHLPQVLTPGKTAARGTHLYARCEQEIRSTKLARITPEEAERRTGDRGKVTAIELKGEAGYVLAPGCPGMCHPTGREYQLIGGPFIEDTPFLSPEQVSILISSAKALDKIPAEEAKSRVYVQEDSSMKPGSIFNRKGAWEEILAPHGWKMVKSAGEKKYWRRPGKSVGVSATTGVCVNEQCGDLLCVFSTNAAPFELGDRDHRCFSKFHAFTRLEHEGNFSKAASALASQGYGVDLALDEAAAEAWRMAARMKKVTNDNREECEAEIAKKLRSENRRWRLTEQEITEKSREAVRWQLEQDPVQFAELAQKEILDGQKTINNNSEKKEPPSWHLVVIESDPPEYLLRSPCWSAKKKVAASGGYIRIKGPHEIRSWSCIGDAAVGQADASISHSIKHWDRILDQLLTLADHVERPKDDRRRDTAKEFLWNIFKSARTADTNPDGSIRVGGGHPKVINGTIVCKITHIMSRARDDSCQFKRREFIDEMLSVGMKPIILENTRWWSADKEAMEELQKAVIENPHKQESEHG